MYDKSTHETIRNSFESGGACVFIADLFYLKRASYRLVHTRINTILKNGEHRISPTCTFEMLRIVEINFAAMVLSFSGDFMDDVVRKVSFDL